MYNMKAGLAYERSFLEKNMDILADAVIKAASEAVDKEGVSNINLKTPEMISQKQRTAFIPAL